MVDRAAQHVLEPGFAAAPQPGERVNGDAAVVEYVPAGMLIAGVDGAGHGPEAHGAALAATDAIRRSPHEDLTVLMAACHQALRGTRGAAVTLALLSIGPPMLTWLGVGTVEGRLLNARRWPPDPRASLRLSSGTVGHDLPAVMPTSTRLEHGDLVVLATDGVRSSFGDELNPHGSSQEVAERVLSEHGRGTDDALVVVVRYVEVRG